MDRARLDQELVRRGLTATRSQAESYIKLGHVKANGKSVTKPGFLVTQDDKIQIDVEEQYVSRAALKLNSVSKKLNLDFEYKKVLDVGSSTGGFTDYALKHGAKEVIAVDVGTEQLHPSLRSDLRVQLYEQTDIRNLKPINPAPDIVVIDVSFISMREVLPAVGKLSSGETQIVAMLKPQFEAGSAQVNKGVVKNDSIRRQIFKDFEVWVKKSFRIVDKADSEVAGSKGNLERFYLLKIL